MRGVGLATDDGLWWQACLGAVEVAAADTDIVSRLLVARSDNEAVTVRGCLATAAFLFLALAHRSLLGRDTLYQTT